MIDEVVFFKSSVFSVIMIIIGTIADLIWFRYAYSMQQKSLILLAILANVFAWGIIHMTGRPDTNVRFWMIVLSKFAVYSWPMSKTSSINPKRIFVPILFPLLISIIIASLLLYVPYFELLRLYTRP